MDYNIEGINNEVTEFISGAVRDIQEDKGRCDLMPLAVIGDLYSVYANNIQSFIKDNTVQFNIQSIYRCINAYVYDGNTDNLLTAITYFLATESPWDMAFEDFGNTLLDLSKHYKHGLEKYGVRNWEKGIPCHSFIDSGVRHLIKHLSGWTDERHDIAFIWNLVGCVHTEMFIAKNFEDKSVILDLPCHKKGVEE